MSRKGYLTLAAVVITVVWATAASAVILGPWEDTGDDIPIAVQDAATVVLDGKLYVVGGSDMFLFELADVQVYDPAAAAGSRWSAVASLNAARFKHAACVLDGKIYAFGGEDLNGRLDSIEVYDPVGDSWTTLTASPKPRSNHAMVGANGLVWVIGGERNAGEEGAEDLGGVSRIVQIYDPVGDAWSEATELPYGTDPNYDNYGAQMAAVGYNRGGTDWITFSGGVGWNTQVGTSGRIDSGSVSNAWQALPAVGARTGHAGVVATDGVGETTMWVLGGELGGFLKDGVSYFGEQEGNVWVDDRPLPEALSGKPGAGLLGEYVYLTAGRDADGFLNTTTYRAMVVGPFEILSIERTSETDLELTFTSSFQESSAYEELSGSLYTFRAGMEGARVWYASEMANPTTWETNVNSDVTVVDLVTTWPDTPGVDQRFYQVERSDPPATGILVEWEGLEPASDIRGDFTGLSYEPVGDDILQAAGVSVTLEAGGFHGAAESIDMGDVANLADSGGPGDGGKSILPRDFAYDQPAIVVLFELPESRDVDEVRVFSSWESGRAFHTYDLEFETTGNVDPVPVASVVRSGPWGQTYGGNAKSYYTRVYREDEAPLGVGVTAVRVKIYDTSDLASPENNYVPPAQAFQSPIVFEVDAMEPAF